MALTDGGAFASSADGRTTTPVEVPDGNAGTPAGTGPLVDERAIPFESWSEVSPTAIAVNFVSGSPNCYGAAAHVQETATTITVTVVTGRLATTTAQTCLIVASYSTLVVTLEQPVGSRQVLSGR